jgi:hypothetical protein
VSQPIALFITVDESDGAAYLNGQLLGYSGQYLKTEQAADDVIAELADVLRERLGWPQTDPRWET